MPQMGYVFQRDGLPSIDPSATTGEPIATGFIAAADAEATANGYAAALNAAFGDVYATAVPQWTPEGVDPERWQVLIDDLLPPGVAVPAGALLQEIGDAWYRPAW